MLTVVLVHGTFAPGAEWSRLGSPLFEALDAACSDIQTVTFDWSGDNSHMARIVAGRSLALRIRQIAKEDPAASVAIVAHSHGGNVALYALRDKAAAAVVSGVVFLGTPFFRFIRMDVRPAVRLFSRIIGFAAYIAALWLMVFAVIRYLPSLKALLPAGPIPYALQTPVIVLVSIAMSLGIMAVVYFIPVWLATLVRIWFNTALLGFLVRQRAKLLRRLTVPSLPVRGLVVRSPRDEAFLYLSGLALLTSSPFFLWSVIVACTRSIPLIAAVLYLAQCNGNAFVPETEAFVSMNSAYVAAIGLACLYPAILATLLVITVPALARGLKYAFGWTGFIGAAVVDVQPAPVPATVPGAAVSVMTRPGKRASLDTLIHSTYYSDPVVHAAVLSFLCGENAGDTAISAPSSARRFQPLLRKAIVGIAVLASAVAMLRYDYLEMQKPLWEEEAQAAPEPGWRDVFSANLAALRLAPQQAHMVTFDFGQMASGDNCRLKGHYRSDGARIEVYVRTVRLSQLDNDAVSLRGLLEWRKAGGGRILPVPESPDAGRERPSLLPFGEEGRFVQSVFSISDDWRRKEVHFSRPQQANLFLIEDSRIVVGRILCQDLDIAIAQTTNSKLVEMIVPPVEGGLNSEMQVLKVPMVGED
ncbi:pimeloyl-ACP methyl ester carboxylesterase [Rhizobium sp. BK077]|nr:pimeloyl-ACP methyl ester carboxylesterase [Rhizobium sp. BK112]MBB3372432.1 pimeloyl-ACP methyl ester carboxylesterase [Rhizobium sp. BK077]MBB4183163.1 pimeloyl-ACP methyl ester carboxylesterase [Rhizobium sp. BK109]